MNNEQETNRPDPYQDRPNQNEETLVHDPRARLTPSQMVEQKLVSLLRTSLPVSTLEASRPVRR
jgi:hypothetical protein